MDIQKLAYDLAMIYAKSRYEDMLRKNKEPLALRHPQYLEDANTVYQLFAEAYTEYLNSTDEYYKEIIEAEKELLP